MSRPRPRVRVLHADPDQPPTLIIDRWNAPTDDFHSEDVRKCGFSGVLVFSADIDLDDDGLGETAATSEIADATGRLEAAARILAEQGIALGMSTALRNLVDSLRTAVDGLDAARRMEGA